MPEINPFAVSAEDAFSRARGIMALVRPAYTQGPEAFVGYIETTANLVREGVYDCLTSKQVDVVISEYAGAIRTLNAVLNAREAVTKAIQGAVMSFSIGGAIIGVSVTVSPWLFTLFVPWLTVVIASLFVSHRCIEWRDKAAVSVPMLEQLKELKKAAEAREKTEKDKAEAREKTEKDKAEAQAFRDAVDSKAWSHGQKINDLHKWDKYKVHGPVWGRITGALVDVNEELTAPPEAASDPTPSEDRTGIRVEDTPNNKPTGDTEEKEAQTPDPPKREERKA